MPKRAKELSATEVRRLKEPGWHAVGGVSGLVLQITNDDARSWILRTTVGAKRRHIGLGGFGDVTLSQARGAARDMKARIRQGVDPIAERRQVTAAILAQQAKRLTFAEAAQRKHAAIALEFRNDKHRKDWLSSLKRHAFPTIGSMDVSDIDLAHVLAVLQPIWKDKTETATRVRQRMETVFAWAIVSGLRDDKNPAEWKANLDQVLPAPAKIAKKSHQRAIEWHEVPGFMEGLRERKGTSARALEFAILTAARSGEVRHATWDEIDLDARMWTVPADRIKAGKAHRVPLSDDAIALLKALPRFEGNDLVFVAPRGGPLSDMSLSAVTKRMSVDATPHGFRSSFKDWARNRSGAADEVSELALAHVNSDATRAAYARDGLLSARVRMMNRWAVFCAEPAAKSTKLANIGAAR